MKTENVLQILLEGLETLRDAGRPFASAVFVPAQALDAIPEALPTFLETHPTLEPDICAALVALELNACPLPVPPSLWHWRVEGRWISGKELLALEKVREVHGHD